MTAPGSAATVALQLQPCRAAPAGCTGGAKTVTLYAKGGRPVAKMRRTERAWQPQR